MTDVDRIRAEALDALRELSDKAGEVKDRLLTLIERDPGIVPDGDDADGDESFLYMSMGRIDQECRTLLYLITGLYGREMVARVAGVGDDDAEPLQ